MLADSDGALASKDIPATWGTAIGVAWVAMTVVIVVLPDIIRWWRDSSTAFRLRWHVRRIVSPLRLLRKRPPKTTAGAGADPTLLPPVDRPREDVR